MSDTETSTPLIKINTLNDLIRAVEEGRLQFGESPWWRGQALSKEWELLPHVYRFNDWLVREHNTVIRFKQKAGVRHLKCPDFKDRADWLFLMQHYHLPTRLLDWTESALVALYFIVADLEKHDKPGLLWGLSPSKLNKEELKVEGVVGPRNSDVAPLFHEAFRGKPSGFNETKKVAAVIADHHDLRQMVQASAFTIHGASIPLNEHDKADDFLVQYEVPAAAKSGLLSILTNLRITRSYLFPDLVNLSEDLKTDSFVVTE